MGRYMIEPLAAGQGAPQRIAITEIAVNLFDLEIMKIAKIAVRPNQHPNVGPRIDQRTGDGCSNKSCCACDESFHRSHA
jgi:hypothetical protein